MQADRLYNQEEYILASKSKRNFRIIRSGLFRDSDLSSEEKGVLIGLYCNCINDTYRFDLSDVQMSERLGVSRGTYLKYKKSLLTKGIICTGEEHSNLLDPEHPNALLLIYPHLGYDFQEYKETAGFIAPQIYPYLQTQV